MTILPSTDRKHRRSPLLAAKHGDFDHRETGFNGASFSYAVFNLSTTIVGAGIMALPATVNCLGLIPGLIMILVAAVLTDSSIGIILRFTKASKMTSYSGVVGDTLGGRAHRLLQFCIVVNNLGMLIVYMIIIGNVLSGTWTDGVHHSGVMEKWFGQHWWTSRTFLLLVTTLFVFAPLISLKRVVAENGEWLLNSIVLMLDSLRYTSALSVALAIVFVAVTAGVTIVKVMDGSIGMPRLMPELVDQASFWRLFTAVPIIVTAYICHHNIHPIENELIDPSQMRSIVRTSLTLCASVYIATSFFGVLLFGDHTLDDILANFDGDLGIPYSSLLDDVVRITYGVHLMLVFPIVFFSLRLNVDGLIYPYAIPIAFDNRRFFSITSGLIGFIFIGAEFIPSIWVAFQFTGATAAVSIGFIFPAAIVLRDAHGIATKKEKLVSWLMIFLAVSSSTVAVSTDIYVFLSKANGVVS